MVGELTERERAMLRMEKRVWRYSGLKDGYIRERFGISPVTYAAELNRLIDTERALAAEPLVVKRLRMIRERRQRAGSARRLGIQL